MDGVSQSDVDLAELALFATLTAAELDGVTQSFEEEHAEPETRLLREGFVGNGFYVVVSHSGVTLGPLWGRIVAAELLEGAVDPRLAPYRPARFLTPRP